MRPGAPCERNVRRLFNPLLLREGHAPITCDFAQAQHTDITILTGPNSGGKTCVLQALSYCQMLGQAGFFAPAGSAELVWAGGMFLSIGERTDAVQKEGRLGMELVGIRQVFEHARVGSFVVVDELCSGTNPEEGQEIFRMVLSLMQQLQLQAYLSTHFLEFARQLQQQLVEFTYTQPPQDSEEASPIVPSVKTIGSARDLLVFTSNEGQLAALALERGHDGPWELTQYLDGARSQLLLELPNTWGSAWLRSCVAAQPQSSGKRYFVAGSAKQAYVGTIEAGVASAWAPLDVAIPAPAPTDRETQVALDCTADGAITIAFIDQASSLHSVTCTAADTECTFQEVAPFATSVDVTHTGARPLVAYSGAPDQPQLRLKHADARGLVETEEQVPGACWDRWGGPCGDPMFA